MSRPVKPPSLPGFPVQIFTGICALLWLAITFEWFYVDALPDVVRLGILTVCLIPTVLWNYSVRREVTLVRALVATVCFPVWWEFSILLADTLGMVEARVNLAQFGLATWFIIGLCWVIWGVEQISRRYESERLDHRLAEGGLEALLSSTAPMEGAEYTGPRIWNPLDPDAWYYGRKSRKLNQSLTALASYSLAFFLCFLLLTQSGGCQEIFELPLGGGEQKAIAQQTVIQKVIKKKFVINPFSLIIFNPPPLDDVKLQLTEATAHTYMVGQGKGDNAGYETGTKRGKVRFIRLEYSGGDWNQDFGVGADLNMLVEYGIRTQQPTHPETESRLVSQLRNFPIGKSPAFVYMTGQRNISLSDPEARILREYLLDKHGMLICDNGGSRHFHNQFLAMMGQVLEHKVEPVPIPLDDVIHSIPYKIPFLPYVAPHGGKEALGWKVDGRWVAYYHPGDIADAWSDGHAGVSPEVSEYCYQLGTNIINYAQSEYSKWLVARTKK